jgi:hypothetical protein
MGTTNKEFKDQVQIHILERLSTDETEETRQQLLDVINGFNDWYGAYEQKRTPNIEAAFKEWLLGLPSSLNIEFEYYTIHQTLKQWFEDTGSEYKEQSSDKEAELYYHLIVREFRVLCRKNGLDFYDLVVKRTFR